MFLLSTALPSIVYSDRAPKEGAEITTEERISANRRNIPPTPSLLEKHTQILLFRYTKTALSPQRHQDTKRRKFLPVWIFVPSCLRGEILGARARGQYNALMGKALEGLRVLDLTRMLPGPYASMILADLGARVLKVEDTAKGDPTRWSPRHLTRTGSTFRILNRGKQSISVNLKSAEGTEIFRRLVRDADVVL